MNYTYTLYDNDSFRFSSGIPILCSPYEYPHSYVHLARRTEQIIIEQCTYNLNNFPDIKEREFV